MPQLRALQDKYSRQMVVLGVNAGETPSQGAAGAKQLQMNFPALLRGDQVMEQYSAPGFPTTYLIDPGGRIVEAQVGANPELWSRVEATVSRFQPPGGDDREAASSGPREAGPMAPGGAFPPPPRPREILGGQQGGPRVKP